MINKNLIILSLALLCCCKEKANQESKAITQHDPEDHSDSLKKRVDSLLEKSIPIIGYRFVVMGDFNGDKKQDTLVEHYTDSLKTKEVAKYDETFDYFDSWYMASLFNKQSYVSDKNNSFQKLEGGTMGFIYIENCGDVSGDGIDDLFVLPHRGGASNCVQGFFYTLENKEWKKLWMVPVWQWQFPDTPGAGMTHGLFGSFEVGHSKDDSLHILLENQLHQYSFIKRYPDHSIEYECRNPLDYQEMDSLSELYEQQVLIRKRFKPVTLNNKIYLQDRKKNNTFYGNITRKKINKEWIYLFPYDDMAEMFTVRIYYKKD